jgi:hypothetical protein
MANAKCNSNNVRVLRQKHRVDDVSPEIVKKYLDDRGLMPIQKSIGKIIEVFIQEGIAPLSLESLKRKGER